MASVEEITQQSLERVDQTLSDANIFLDSLANAATTDLFNGVPYVSTVVPFYNVTQNVRLAPVLSSAQPAAIPDTEPAPSVGITAPTTLAVPEFNLAAPTVQPVGDVGVVVDEFSDALPDLEQLELDVQPVPSFDDASPALNFPAPPSTSLPISPGAAPEFVAPNIPQARDYTLPDVPVLLQYSIPSPPTTQIPLFSEIAPDYDLTPPSEEFVWTEREYQSDLLDEARKILLSDIQNGGYGIRTEDETPLWDRARDRIVNQAEAELRSADRMAAARGFPLPTGAQNALITQAQQSVTSQLSDINREISIKRAEMYVQARQFAITTGLSAEQFLLSYHASVEERALNAAKFVIEAAINLFNARAQDFNARLGRWQAKAQFYETEIRAALAPLEQYRAELEGSRITSQINSDQLDLYRSQIAGVEALIGIYQSEMQAANIAADIERIKLQAFAEQVNVYATRVRARSDEFGMYETGVRAEIAKSDNYQGAFAQRLNAARLGSDINLAKVNVTREDNRLRLDRFGVSADKFRSNLDAGRLRLSGQEANVNAKLGEGRLRQDGFQSEVAGFGARIDANRAHNANEALKLDAEVQEGRLLLDAYQQKLNKYLAVLSNENDKVRLLLQKAGIDVDVWREQQRNDAAFEGLRSNNLNEGVNNSLRAYAANIQNAELSLRNVIAGLDANIRGSAAGVDFYKSLVASAQSSINAIATLAE
ncbi:hypothetical protein ED236_00515 [Pseudomethylobacillus aquaticus]|uniref:Uncharacterized protein n=1 Tax=Pseudomethylobacillus aquaticus TaxID=2676064 RepID=A0A3N0V604_9PROT|nr:hypothetical protein [Pseudomethylobacillus aquaticus]ROH88011.1 hypothetical protein ED236_00515 [Pseudomethylobacillus aquaticus]